ncbi:MAG: rhamnan synthesis F family protein [Roseibium sp.]|uniref:rhamnan synthesis F family protein n=1 Tax=Roseibium sp. TaxID=1936156 RepID=UPI003D9C2192
MTHFVDVAKEYFPLLAGNDEYDVRMFLTQEAAQAAQIQEPRIRRRIILPTDNEALFIRSHFVDWDADSLSKWKELMEGGPIAAGYERILARIYAEYPFDLIVHWGENGAVTRFARDRNLTKISMELGPTRPPFLSSLVLDPFGTNGAASVPRMSVEDIREIVDGNGMPASVASLLFAKDFDSEAAEFYFENISADNLLKLRSDRKYVFFPLQLYDDANLIRFSSYDSISELLLEVVPRLVEHGFCPIIKPHPAAKYRQNGISENAKARHAIRQWSEDVVWLEDEANNVGNSQLISLSEFVVTVNSSVGFEALYQDKVVCVLGDAIYKPKNLFPTLDEITSDQFDREEYLENISYLRRFFFSSLLFPRDTLSSFSRFTRICDTFEVLWKNYPEDACSFWKEYFKRNSENSQYRAMRGFSDGKLQEVAVFERPTKASRSLENLKMQPPTEAFPIDVAKELYLYSGCADVSAFRGWLKNLWPTQKGALEIMIAGNVVDSEFYLKEYPDVAAVNFNPIRHFTYFGLNENRKPSRDFGSFSAHEFFRKLLVCLEDKEFLAFVEKGSLAKSTAETTELRSRIKEQVDELRISAVNWCWEEHPGKKLFIPGVFSSLRTPQGIRGVPQPEEPKQEKPRIENPVCEAPISEDFKFVFRNIMKHLNTNEKLKLLEFLRKDWSNKENLLSFVVAGRVVDRTFYARNNPDVVASGTDFNRHFAFHGLHEGRQPSARIPGMSAGELQNSLLTEAEQMSPLDLEGRYPLDEAERQQREEQLENIRRSLADSKAEIAVVAHMFYVDLVPEMLERLEEIPRDFDLLVTLPTWGAGPIEKLVIARFPSAQFYRAPNRGRDIGPFVGLLPIVMQKGYKSLLKIQSKKGYFRSGRFLPEYGDLWRKIAFDCLLGNGDKIEKIIKALDCADGPLMIGPTPLLASQDRYPYHDHGQLAEFVIGDQRDVTEKVFFAGSMFWANPSCLAPLVQGRISSLEAFPPETGASHGEVAHLVERLFGELGSGSNTGLAAIGQESDASVTLSPQASDDSLDEIFTKGLQAGLPG